MAVPDHLQNGTCKIFVLRLPLRFELYAEPGLIQTAWQPHLYAYACIGTAPSASRTGSPGVHISTLYLKRHRMFFGYGRLRGLSSVLISSAMLMHSACFRVHGFHVPETSGFAPRGGVRNPLNAAGWSIDLAAQGRLPRQHALDRFESTTRSGWAPSRILSFLRCASFDPRRVGPVCQLEVFFTLLAGHLDLSSALMRFDVVAAIHVRCERSLCCRRRTSGAMIDARTDQGRRLQRPTMIHFLSINLPVLQKKGFRWREFPLVWERVRTNPAI